MHVKGAFMSNDPISTDETQITLTLPPLDAELVWINELFTI